MKSIKSNYEKIQKENPNLGTYPCLVKAVKGKNFSRKSLVKAFNQLMPRDDYKMKEKTGLIKHLQTMTNMPEEGEI